MPDDSTVQSHVAIKSDQPIKRLVIDLVARPVIDSVAIPRRWYDALRNGDLTKSHAALLLALHRADPYERFRFTQVSATNVLVEGIHEVDLRDLGAQISRDTVYEAMSRYVELKFAEQGKRGREKYWQLYPYKILQWRRGGRAFYHLYPEPGLPLVEVEVLEQVIQGDDADDAGGVPAKSDAPEESDGVPSEFAGTAGAHLRSAGARFESSSLPSKTDPEDSAARAFNRFEGAARAARASGSDFERQPGGKIWSAEREKAFNLWMLEADCFRGIAPSPLPDQRERDYSGMISRFRYLIWPDNETIFEGRRRMSEAMRLLKLAVGKDCPLAWVYRSIENFVDGKRPQPRAAGTDPMILIRGILRTAKLRGEDPRGEWTVRHAGSSCGWKRDVYLDHLDEFQAAQECRDELEEASR